MKFMHWMLQQSFLKCIALRKHTQSKLLKAALCKSTQVVWSLEKGMWSSLLQKMAPFKHLRQAGPQACSPIMHIPAPLWAVLRRNRMTLLGAGWMGVR